MKRIYGWGLLVGVVALGIGLPVLLRYQRPSETVESIDVSAFLQRHWRLPIAPQGKPPATYTPLEASLHPKDCGACHPQQYADWQTSMHSRSMGPGVYGQLLDMEPATSTVCAACHTPLSEQLPELAHRDTYSPNKAFDATLQQQGLVCAACHVRQHQRFGPPRRADLPPLPAGTPVPHSGFTESVAFQRAEFCMNCHQFNPGDFALNGKLIENTYDEWQQSVYAKEGRHCQSCHMPDRRHLWRGIHDADMVKQALSVTVTPPAVSYQPGDTIQIVITMTNSGAGHYLPTYVTPKIFVQVQLLDAQGQSMPDSAQEVVIGREVTLDLSAEVYDTRIPPKASRSFTYAQVMPTTATALRVRVVVHPDHFYERFFAANLHYGEGGKGRAHLEEALRRTQSSSFTVLARDFPLAQN
jgi:hypothetical protein